MAPSTSKPATEKAKTTGAGVKKPGRPAGRVGAKKAKTREAMIKMQAFCKSRYDLPPKSRVKTRYDGFTAARTFRLNLLVNTLIMLTISSQGKPLQIQGPVIFGAAEKFGGRRMLSHVPCVALVLPEISRWTSLAAPSVVLSRFLFIPLTDRYRLTSPVVEEES